MNICERRTCCFPLLREGLEKPTSLKNTNSTMFLRAIWLAFKCALAIDISSIHSQHYITQKELNIYWFTHSLTESANKLLTSCKKLGTCHWLIWRRRKKGNCGRLASEDKLSFVFSQYSYVPDVPASSLVSSPFLPGSLNLMSAFLAPGHDY